MSAATSRPAALAVVSAGMSDASSTRLPADRLAESTRAALRLGQQDDFTAVPDFADLLARAGQ